MIAVRPKVVFLFVCIFEAMFILVAQVFGNSLLLLAGIGFYVAFVVFSAIKGMAVPVLLFFLPFAALIKLQPGTTSFYTIALLAIYIVFIVMGSRKINVLHLVPALCIIAMALVVKTLYGYSIDKSFILFAASLLIVPFVSRELDDKYDFYWLTVFFSLGIIIAAISAQYLVAIPTITRLVGARASFGFVRYSGYYGDPNFYSAHITAALSGIFFFLLNKRSSKKRIIIVVLFAIALLYCGFLSVSKSFVLVTICLFFVWMIEFMFQKGRLSAKLMILMSLFIGMCFLLSSTLFTDLIDMMLMRFSSDRNLSDFTTGRTDIWYQYIKAFIDEPLLLLFGKGFTKIFLNERATHNTVIQAVFQFGLVGCGLLVCWILSYLKEMLNGVKIQQIHIAQVVILLIGVFGPWMAIDLLFFDEFFLMPIYVCVAIRFMGNDENNMNIVKQMELKQ